MTRLDLHCSFGVLRCIGIVEHLLRPLILGTSAVLYVLDGKAIVVRAGHTESNNATYMHKERLEKVGGNRGFVAALQEWLEEALDFGDDAVVPVSACSG